MEKEKCEQCGRLDYLEYSDTLEKKICDKCYQELSDALYIDR